MVGTRSKPDKPGPATYPNLPPTIPCLQSPDRTPKCCRWQRKIKTMNKQISSKSPVAQPRFVLRGCDEPSGALGQSKLGWIRRMYGVPAKCGMRIYYGTRKNGAVNGTITGARDGRLLIRLDDFPPRRAPLAFHPTWNIHYPQNAEPCRRAQT